ncbi:hypothetical protein A3A76_03350 [Candidatus Woesebacteria bacterium RIFCSPLOWO2_01_FULL_39_23]|uniref:Uncharacterized protein n=1 Tax=Candidatus Woesebacteria bacterium RIFCSPHIGHO2_01_FULL_40_22 TaxID=1802499 RepID=A0A1F7YJM6_9BACT|nr:MAG: hypothetical protein A2141_00675 [Candidatus Woesebacteria bacterium RBG_16_40_11]OGM27493.1 MAG: hypothetical protein A2628_01750 [Candidatus Woesebacteria bacterium RIFCSPHIGHO2_01_FULL_40_22]OGM36550.1 MAG: hypothetical protein A3E41_03895 [Candidatus Woesebacteria bacterium RIFCSPHIGHO2_12_FULL_38_9]OGM62667.1 MAG: hypothetical protein A3A76_03350 [Candidatus Woesebacteria bacterium RIFCSPLOWO2_01_FULL_39_23]
MTKKSDRAKYQKFNFKDTLLNFQLWAFATAYQLFGLYAAILSLPSKSAVVSPIQSITSQIVTNTKNVVLPTGGRPVKPIQLALFLQIIIFNIFFVLIYYLINKTNKKIYNPYAILCVGVIISLVFVVISRVL